MAMNFRIIQQKNKNHIRLMLDGDFDGTSAYELINTLKSCGQDVSKVYIDTDGIKTVYPFGQVVLHRHLSGLGGRYRKLVFSGDHGRRLSKPWRQ